MAKYICSICGYVYDEQKEKVQFKDLPTNWVCPLCGAVKADFIKKEEIVTKAEPIKLSKKEDVAIKRERELTNSELNVLCTNLAKGCEKQYLDEEAELFTEIAKFYKKRSEKAEEGTFDSLVELLNKDSSEYFVTGFEIAKSDSDRGALRVLTWSDKVTKIVSALIARYKKEGTAFLQNTKIFVCEICGFIYVGGEAPEICPICKVPKLKINEVGGVN